jgi:hypothetical protein
MPDNRCAMIPDPMPYRMTLPSGCDPTGGALAADPCLTGATQIGDATAIATIYKEGMPIGSPAVKLIHARPSKSGVGSTIRLEGDDWTLLAFASTSSYRDRSWYAGIAGSSVSRGPPVSRDWSGERDGQVHMRTESSAGRIAMMALIGGIQHDYCSGDDMAMTSPPLFDCVGVAADAASRPCPNRARV